MVRERGGRLIRVALISSIGVTGVTLASTDSASAAEARTYYVSATGNDAHDGTSPATAWRTLKPVNSRNLAGDTVRLEGGSTFTGPVYLDSRDSGVTVDSFGTGRPRIIGEGSSAVLAYDANNVTVRHLDLVGDADAFANKGGVTVYNDLPARHRLSGITLSGISARGFKNGIEIGAANPGAGFAHVSIDHVKAVGNRDAGIITYGPAFVATSPSYAHADVRVRHAVANRNLGNPADTVHNSGNGIVLGSVDRGSILHSSAAGNGVLCTAPEGPAGIWTYDSRAIRIAYNKATNNRTASNVDGDGFDLDQNVTDSILEHNTSSGNDGAGFLVYGGHNGKGNRSNAVRWNTSRGDARKNNWYGGITLAGHVRMVTVSRNTVDTSTSASRPPALAIKHTVSKARISHNSLRAARNHIVVAREP